jgi:hypothetical protein
MILKDHFSYVENALLALYRVPSTSGHNLHKGNPRESFVREFLREHLGESLRIGTGEIIDANTESGGSRPQMDIVIYRNDFPKIHFGGDTYGFLAESVIATIEVKSKLARKDVLQAVGAAKEIKALKRNQNVARALGYYPPSIMNYVVAYEGPASIETEVYPIV